jgi:hypothetical protein
MLAAYIRSQNAAFSIFRLVHEYDAKIAKGNNGSEKNIQNGRKQKSLPALYTWP